MLTLRERLGAVPLLVLPVGIYGALAALDRARGDVGRRLTTPLFDLGTPARGAWPVTLADLFLAGTLVVFFLELLKSMATRRLALVNHAFAMVLFVGCLTAMLLAPAFATSTFFLVTLTVLLDVVAGFIATVARDTV